MTILRLALSIGGLWALGFGLLPVFLPKTAQETVSFGLRAGLGLGLGLGLVSLHYFFWRLVLDNPAPALAAVEAAVIIGMMLVYLLRTRPQVGAIKDLFNRARAGISRPGGVAILFWLGLFALVVIEILGFLKTPQGGWDAWMIWNMKARFLFRGQENWTNMLSLNVPHPDYPLLLSTNVARVWSLLGKEARSAAFLIGLLPVLAIPFLLVSSLAKFRDRTTGYLAGMTVLISPAYVLWGFAQYADILLAFFFLAAVVVFTWFDQASDQPPRLLVLAGVFTGLGVWTKQEGWLFLVAVLLVRTLLGLFTKPRGAVLREFGAFAVGLGPVLLVVVYHQFAMAPPTFLAEEGSANLLARVWDTGRMGIVAGEFLRQTIRFDPSSSTPLAVLFLLPWFFGLDRARLRHPAIFTGLAVTLVMLGGYALVFLVTPFPLVWHLDTALARLFLHIWPLAVFTLFLFTRAPGGLREP